MAFAAIYVADFMIQAVVRAEPELRGCAMALIEGTRPLRKVVAANNAAFAAGIELGMTESQAEDFCAARVRARAPALEKAAHAALLDLSWSISPRVEDTAADTIVLDLAGLTSLLGSDEMIAEQAIERASRLGLVARVAIASNIEAAIQAARGFPGVTLIAAGEEAKRLGGLPVSVLSSNEEILATLESWGVRTCEALGALPVLELSERLGQEGVRLHELARGANSRALVLCQPESYFEEEMELEDAVPELEPLSFLLRRLLDQLCVRLEARSLAAAAIRVRFELEPVDEKNVRSLNDVATQKPAPPVYEKLLTLPVPTRNSKMLLKLMRLRLQTEPPQTAVLKIFMAAEAARPRFAQGGLFLPSSPDPERLELTVARLANLVGDQNVGAPALVDSHRPDAFRMRRFMTSRVPDVSGEKVRSAAKRKPGPMSVLATDVENKSEAQTRRARVLLRVFRPAVQAVVEMGEGRPARIAFNGMRGEVVAASGPWRTSGDWWREDGWKQDEWDISVRFAVAAAARAASRQIPVSRRHAPITSADLFSVSVENTGQRGEERQGLYCIYYDAPCGKWFVRGMYD